MPIILDEMMDPRVTRRDMLPLSYLKMSSYTGSKRQLRYKLEKTEVELPAEPVPDTAPQSDDAGEGDTGTAAEHKEEAMAEAAPEPQKITVLRIYTWTGPFAFDVTPAEEMQIHDVEFSDAGIDEAIEHLNSCLDRL